MSAAASDRLVIRTANAGDLPAILELMKVSLGEGKIPRDDRYWSWKHVENPFGRSPVMLAETNGRLVGLRVFMRWTWEAGGREIFAVRAVDTATHPHWRGQGIFKRLTLDLAERMKEEGVSFVFNTPNEQSMPGYLKMGWSSVGRTTLRIRLMRPIRSARALLRRDGGDGGVFPSLREMGFASVGELLEQPELSGLLGGMELPGNRLATPLTKTYLRWRYVEVPGFEYGAAWSFEGSRGAAIVFRFKEQGALRELRVCDVLTEPGRDSIRAVRTLLRSVMGRSDADFAAGMAARGTPEAQALLGAGFLPAPRTGPILTALPLNDVGVDPLQARTWHASVGALELF